MTKKITLTEYYDWHEANLGENLRSEDLKKKYELNLTVAQAALNGHAFIKQCAALLGALAGQKIFALATESKGPDFTFVTKPYPSVVDKTFRLNCNWNRAFPKEPNSGWIKAAHWFSNLDDLVRTSLVCRYLDGPKIVCSNLAEEAKKFGLDAEYGPRATDAGYYAYHCYVSVPMDLLSIYGAEVVQTPLKIEIQVTTQLQEILRDLTHPFYRAVRIGSRRPLPVERWDFETAQFKASYLAHTLHLIEGMIVQLRDEGDAITQKPDLKSSETATEGQEAAPPAPEAVAEAQGEAAVAEGQLVAQEGQAAAPQGPSAAPGGMRQHPEDKGT